MIIKTDDSFIRAKIVYSVVIYTDTKVTYENQGWFKPKLRKETTGYQLIMDYLGEDEGRYKTTWSHPNKAPLEKLHQDLVKQIKAQDHQYADQLLEEAILNAGEEKK